MPKRKSDPGHETKGSRISEKKTQVDLKQECPGKKYGEKGKEKRWESKDLKQGKHGESYNLN